MTEPFLAIDPEKCNGCMDCVEACAAVKSRSDDRRFSRIRIFSEDPEAGPYLPMACRQCAEAPCMAVCPKEAIYRDLKTNRVMTDYDRCVACRMCTFACPFGAIGFDEDRGPFKCDVCGGEPACVPVCEPCALYLTDAAEIHYDHQRRAALRTAGIRGA